MMLKLKSSIKKNENARVDNINKKKPLSLNLFNGTVLALVMYFSILFVPLYILVNVLKIYTSSSSISEKKHDLAVVNNKVISVNIPESSSMQKGSVFDNEIIKQIMLSSKITEIAIKKNLDNKYYVSFWNPNHAEKNYILENDNDFFNKYNSYNGDVLKLVLFKDNLYLSFNKNYNDLEKDTNAISSLILSYLNKYNLNIRSEGWNKDNIYIAARNISKELSIILKNNNIDKVLLTSSNDKVLLNFFIKNNDGFFNDQEIKTYFMNDEDSKNILSYFNNKLENVALINNKDDSYQLFLNKNISSNYEEGLLDLEKIIYQILRKEQI